MERALHLGTTMEAIEAAESELGVRFPDVLREVWLVSNGLELPGDWELYPVFDPANPRKTFGSVVHENTRGRTEWDDMADDLISIAGNGTGNRLVLRKAGEALDSEILVWNHETNKTRKWGRSLCFVLDRARARVSSIQAARAKAMRERR